jgi:hypothetical protein
LAGRLGVARAWVKNDAVSHPTLSFKDRVVSVALSKAREFGFDTVDAGPLKEGWRIQRDTPGYGPRRTAGERRMGAIQ